MKRSDDSNIKQVIVSCDICNKMHAEEKSPDKTMQGIMENEKNALRIFALETSQLSLEKLCKECTMELLAAHTFYRKILDALSRFKELEVCFKTTVKELTEGSLLESTITGGEENSGNSDQCQPLILNCDRCLQTFESLTSLRKHIKHHRGTVCTFCDHGFITEGALMEHVSDKHHDRLFHCRLCPRTEKLRKLLNRHLRTAHETASESEYYCGHCLDLVSYPSLAALEEHLAACAHTHHEVPYHQESSQVYEEELLAVGGILFEKNLMDCDKPTQFEENGKDESQSIFLRNFELIRKPSKEADVIKTKALAQVSSNVNRMILEEFLDEAFENDQIWNKYIEGGEEYLIDSYEFDLDSTLVVTKSMSNAFKCPRCKESYEKQHSLMVHLAEGHEMFCLVCNDCGTSFNRLADFRHHRMEHLKDNALFRENVIPEAEEALALVTEANSTNYTIVTRDTYLLYACNICQRKFRKKCNFEKHNCLSSHLTNPVVTENKPSTERAEEQLFCTLCDKKFTSIAGLKYHLKRHTNVKAFACVYCEKRFPAHSNLISHVRNVHQDPSSSKHYKCEQCGRGFPSKDHLTKHVRSSAAHETVKRFACPECSKHYYQKCHLSEHIEAVHSGYKAFRCEQCTAVYGNRRSLRRHVAKNH